MCVCFFFLPLSLYFIAQIEDGLAEDIFTLTAGHPGSVCLCGKRLDEEAAFSHKRTRRVSLSEWQQWVTRGHLLNTLRFSANFRSFSTWLASNRNAVDLLYTCFAVASGPVACSDDSSLADSLVGQGILLATNTLGMYAIASPMWRMYLWAHSHKYNRPRQMSVPDKQRVVQSLELDGAEALITVISYLDPAQIATGYATKLFRQHMVPSEAVYELEMNTIFLSNKIHHTCVAQANVQHKLNDPRARADMVLVHSSGRVIVLEYAASNENRETDQGGRMAGSGLSTTLPSPIIIFSS